MHLAIIGIVLYRFGTYNRIYTDVGETVGILVYDLRRNDDDYIPVVYGVVSFGRCLGGQISREENTVNRLLAGNGRHINGVRVRAQSAAGRDRGVKVSFGDRLDGRQRRRRRSANVGRRAERHCRPRRYR